MWYAKADCGYLNMVAKRLSYDLPLEDSSTGRSVENSSDWSS
jgi:hypothetical protein